MKISFVAGFGPIVTDMSESYRFYHDGLGIPFEGDPAYWHTDEVDGVKAFALWPLEAAAESCFGQKEWPRNVPVPQAWLEFDVASPAAVGEAAEELKGRGYRLLGDTRVEPWGQTIVHLLSPEGLLLGVAYTPWMHEPAPPAASPEASTTVAG
jgi:catechol 2,3-dioxygenase-like lactoylglutathione lyase family enzyme